MTGKGSVPPIEMPAPPREPIGMPRPMPTPTDSQAVNKAATSKKHVALCGMDLSLGDFGGQPIKRLRA